MSLEEWSRASWLQEAETTVAEILQLFQVVDRDLSDAQAKGLSVDGRFQHAYDAALQLCMIALRASGYRVPKGQGHHKRAIESIQYTLGSRYADTADHLERCSRLRSKTVYERIGAVGKTDADELVEVAQRLRGEVLEWLERNHPELLPPGM
jgi:hypothetical protein